MHSLRILLTECRILLGPREAAALALHQTLLKDSVESSKAFHGLHNHRNGIQRGEAQPVLKLYGPSKIQSPLFNSIIYLTFCLKHLLNNYFSIDSIGHIHRFSF